MEDPDSKVGVANEVIGRDCAAVSAGGRQRHMPLFGRAVWGRQVDALHLALLIVPILIILALVARNDSWIFTRVGWLDPWKYVGYGYHYADPTFLADDYKISRLPWVLIQYYVRGLFDPVAAQYVLQIGCLSATAFFFALAIRRLLGEVPALVGAAFLITITFTHGPAHSSHGADYHTALSGPLYAAAFYLLVRSAQVEDSFRHAYAFGAVFGAALHTNILYLNLVPILAAHWILTRRQLGRPPRLQAILGFSSRAIIGFIALTIVLGLINWSYGRQFLFFLPQFEMAAPKLVDSAEQARWWLAWSSAWLGAEYYPGLLIAGTGLAGFLAVAARRVKLGNSKRFQIANLSGQYLFLVIVWSIWQTLGQTALQPGYYAYPLWIPLACVVASLVALRDDRLTNIQLAIAGIVTLCAFALPYSFYQELARLLQFLPSVPTSRIAVLYVGSFLLVLLLIRSRNGLYATIAILGLSNPLASEFPAYYTRSQCPFGRDNELALISAHRHLANLAPSDRIFIWTPSPQVENVSVSNCSAEPARYFADSLAWSGFHNLSVPDYYSPVAEIPQSVLETIARLNDAVVVLATTQEQHALQLRARFAAIGKRFEPPKLLRIDQGTASIPLYILR